jgi:hypothetical protein
MANGSSDPPNHTSTEREKTMNALRKFRTAVVIGVLTLLALGTAAAPAHAKYPYSDVYCRDVYFGNRAAFGNTLQFYPTTSLSRGYCRTTSFSPTYNFRAKAVCSPVVLYDSFGRPYFVNQTNYPTLLR